MTVPQDRLIVKNDCEDSMPVDPLPTLLASADPLLRCRIRTQLLGEAIVADDLRRAADQSPVIQALLSERGPNGEIPRHPYAKFTGPHWVLAHLADLGYPPGDENLIPLREQELKWLFSAGQRKKIVLEGRVRTCASMEGNALYALCELGLADERAAQLAEDLIAWQWPDGGWNCDRNPAAHHSSFHETITPLRGLLAYHRHLLAHSREDSHILAAAERAADVFLKRAVLFHQSGGEVIHPSFAVLHVPHFWHYDLLFGLKVLSEGGWLGDPRSQAALALLESKRLPDGGFPAEKAWHRTTLERISNSSRADWGGASKRRMNPFATADALVVLKRAGEQARQAAFPQNG